jgi:seryl-tRNA synthetase
VRGDTAVAGSGLVVGRTGVALLENFQQEDGIVRIPKIEK